MSVGLYLVAGFILLMLWVMLIPGAELKQITRPERTILRVFIGLKAVMPLVLLQFGQNADSLFTSGWDGRKYHDLGVAISQQLHTQGFSTLHRKAPGTGVIDLLVGHLYFIGQPSETALAYLMSSVAGIGTILFWLVTRRFVVSAYRRYYAAAALLLPSTLFWGSNTGKEPLIVLGLSAAVAAFTEVVSGNGRRTAKTLAQFATAVLALALVRPHIALLLFSGLLATAALGSRSFRRWSRPRRRVLISALGFAALAVAVPQSGELLNPQGGDSLLDAAYARAEQTADGLGGSAYEAEPVRSIVDVPSAVATVLFRPYPWEARSLFQALAAAEGVAILVLLLIVVRDMTNRRNRIRLNPVAQASLVYALLFCSAFVTAGNFGLLVRQRMQVIPFVIFLGFVLRLKTERNTVSQQRLPGALSPTTR